MLRNIEKDATYNQDIEPFGPDGVDYYSFDLTAATDRIPIEIYREMFVVWKGSKYADAWTRIKIK